MNVKCQICEEKFDREIMNRVEVGKKKKSNKYYCDDCYPKFLKEKEFKQRELLEWDSLYKTILEVHKLGEISQRFIADLQNIRNGTVVVKRYKEGIRYKALEITYKFCKDKIRKAKRQVPLNGDYGELKYGLEIVITNLDNARKQWRNNSLRKEKNEESKKSAAMISEINKKINEQKNTKNENTKINKVDITTLFD